MNTISIKYRIMMISFIAMLGMAVTATMFLLDKNRTTREMALLDELGGLAPAISQLVHQLQKERGMNAGFIGSKGGKFSTAIRQQWMLTDAELYRLRALLVTFNAVYFGDNVVKKVKNANVALDNITVIRTNIINLNFTVQQSGRYFSGTIAKLLSIIEEMAYLSSNTDINRTIAAYTNFLHSKDRAAMERAMGAAGFEEGKFPLPIYLNFVKLIGQQEVLLSNFKQNATSKQTAFYDRTLAGTTTSEISRMRKIAYESLKTGHTGGVDGKYWFDVVSWKINLMKKVDDRISSDLLKQTADIHDSARQVFWWLTAIIASFIIGIVALAYFIIRGITEPLQNLTFVMGQMATGNNGMRIPYQGQGDEIGKMARAVEVFKGNSIERSRLEKEEAKSNWALHESNERFKGLFENTEISIWNQDFSEVFEILCALRLQGITDLRQYFEGDPNACFDLFKKIKVRHVNQASLTMFEAKDRKELIRNSIELLGPNAIDTITELCCTFWEGHQRLRSEVKFKTIGGKTFDAIISLQVPKTKDGYKSIPISIIDITGRKKLETQVRRAQKMEAIGELTGGLAHDFNNILGIIQGNFEILQRMLIDDKKALSRVELGLKGAARGAELTRKLLNFSTKDVAGTKRISVNSIIRDMEDFIAKSLTVSVDLNFLLDDDAWLIDADPGDFQDAIINLALNARDAMQDGGHLVIETQNKILDEEYSRVTPQGKAGEFVMLSVSDTGHGMSPELQDRVLEPFFTTKENGKGTGLGLSMVYGFVQRSGGHIKIYSEVDKGTTFRIYLPRAKEQVRQIESSQDVAVNLPAGTETILIVDDEKGLRNIATIHLEQLGYLTVAAENGKQALEVLNSRHDIDLLFTDVVMPGGLDGYQLALKAREKNPTLNILLTSGFTRKQNEFNHGEELYLAKLSKNLVNKPYNLEELSIAIRRAIDKSS